MHRKFEEIRYKKFKAWYDEKVAGVMTETMKNSTEDWLAGDIDGLKACNTKIVSVEIPDKKPYHPYRKFRVDFGGQGQ